MLLKSFFFWYKKLSCGVFVGRRFVTAYMCRIHMGYVKK